MTRVQGAAYIAGQMDQSSTGFQALNPATDEKLPGLFPENGINAVNAAAEAAEEAWLPYSQLSDAARANFLRCIAEELEQLRDAIVERGMAETALPEIRLNGELSRTTGQLQLFANLLEEGGWVRATIDTADPERAPLPKPDIRLMQQSLGPVAVFGASNFPLAFSTAGGDTASALAAGCPVIVKGHPAHPGTSELVAVAINNAISKHQLPAGVFSLLQGSSIELGSELVKHPSISAVGFTGSLAGGRALFDLASQRPQPIPFYGELGSTNPVFLLPDLLEQKATQLAPEFVTSLTMGCGQFCTNPGIIIGCAGDALDAFLSTAAEMLQQQPANVMLTPGIANAYRNGRAKLEACDQLDTLAKGLSESGHQAQAALFRVAASDYLQQPELEDEVFGPSALVIVCDSPEQMLAVAETFNGHLTSTIHATESDQSLAAELLPVISRKVGRVLFGGWPTGVEVCHAMTHGGPYPASTDSRSTSVGSRAIDRWVRPVSFQNTPNALLPEALQNENPLKIWRTINGAQSRDAI